MGESVLTVNGLLPACVCVFCVPVCGCVWPWSPLFHRAHKPTHLCLAMTGLKVAGVTVVNGVALSKHWDTSKWVTPLCINHSQSLGKCKETQERSKG